MTNRVNARVFVAAVALIGVLAACSPAGTDANTRPGSTVQPDRSTPAFEMGVATTTPIGGRTSARGTTVSVPSVAGPITGGHQGQPFNAMPHALAEKYGYVEEEFLVSGEATAYSLAGSPAGDGLWTARPTNTAPYATRLLVRRPADAGRSDGSVVVEWLNVSAGQDSDVEFAQLHDELMSHGTTWVGVSAQSVGIAGGTAMTMPGLTPSPLTQWDPLRYERLTHPGDDYSYDMFSQVGAALLHPRAVDPLAGAPVRALIAAGESQSAARLVTYVDAVHPVARVFDGYLIHSRGEGGAPLEVGSAPLPHPVRIRADLDVPVFQFETETDVLGLQFAEARQPDADQLRTWEVAGTSHLDRHLLDYLRNEASPANGAGESEPVPGTAVDPGDPIATTCGPVNDGPQSAVLSKAMADLRAWVLDGRRPASGPPIDVRDGAIVRDEHGIARGGIRTPPVDAPIAALRGDTTADRGYVCSLFGSTKPLDPLTLAQRYPDRAAYIDAVGRSARSAVDAGHLLDTDANAFIEQARHISPGWWATAPP